ncbi:MAG: hypothetical protein ACU836_14545 [Gammaproteobacteria bacterium]
MKVINRARYMLVLLFPLLTGSANASGITDAGLPAFMDNDERIKITKMGTDLNPYWQMVGIGLSTSLLVGDGELSNAIAIPDGSVSYKANFNSDGQLITEMDGQTLSNFLLVNGSLPAGSNNGFSWSDQPYQVLLRAELMDMDPENGTPDPVGTFGGFALGFNTHFLGGWASEGLNGNSMDESLWLYGFSTGFHKLIDALDGNNANGTLASLIGSSLTINDVTSVATVPLPGATWMFLTGVMTLLARRKSTEQSLTSA